MSPKGIARHTVAILGTASLALLLPLTGNADWAKFALFVLVAGAVANWRHWHPARVTRAPWWTAAAAGVGALVVAGGSFMIARKLGLAAATIGSFRVLTVAVIGGLVWSIIGLSDRFFVQSAEHFEDEAEEVRTRVTLPRPKKPINSRR